LPVSFILYGCPYESNMAFESHPVELIDTSLLGYWYGIVKDGSDFFGIEALDITKKSDSAYFIIRYGKSVKGDIILPDTAYFTGYTSTIGNQKFMNVESSVVTVITERKKPPTVKTETVYYLAAFETSHDTLTMKTITETFLPIHKVFNSPEELREIVTPLLENHKDIYDELYSLSYKKTEKPQPLNTQ